MIPLRHNDDELSLYCDGIGIVKDIFMDIISQMVNQILNRSQYRYR